MNYPVHSSSQGNFVLGHLDVAGFTLEFLQSPGPHAPDDFVRRFIERYGEGMHHLTIDVKDFEGYPRIIRARQRAAGRTRHQLSRRAPVLHFAVIRVRDAHPDLGRARRSGRWIAISGQSIPMLRTIFFDAAGTLFEPRIPIGESYARVAARHGVVTTAAAVGAGISPRFP